MGRDDLQLKAAKKAYKLASAEGHRQEEARWANVIGDILKQRGEYVEALRWLRIDYEVSVKHLPEKQLLPTCQSLGEVYFRLNSYKEALIYQKKHLRLAKDTNDLIEQQRACTQLGRTYHEIFCGSEDHHYALQNAKMYFKLAMKLARTLKENSPSNRSSFFLKEYIDAHNNIGMLEIDLDNLDEAQKILLEGLKICDEEEVVENDDGRSRLHNNLGSLYLELRAWDKSRQHIERDILICKRIGHLQGEAKGFINLGELHYRVQKYDEANRCYQKALDIARSMEDEDGLVNQINQNIKIVKEAVLVLEEMKNEEQKLKKLTRSAAIARATPGERRCLLEQIASLDRLIEKSRIISAWPKHREFAKRKKRVASELCDKEKLSDSFLVIGDSYQKLRNFNKARKWYMKSWNVYRSIGNLEGQALVKINIGDVLDSAGDWGGALESFEEGYRIAVQGNLPNVQLSALDNMHYSHMIRFDNVEEARKLQQDMQNLKRLLNEERGARNLAGECCSETDTGGCDLSDNGSDECNSLKTSVSGSTGSDPHTHVVECRDDLPLISHLRSSKNSSKPKTSQVDFHGKEASFSEAPTNVSSRYLSKLMGHQQPLGRKRVRIVLSDDEIDEEGETDHSRGRLHKCPMEDVATSEEVKTSEKPAVPVKEFQDFSHANLSKDLLTACTPTHLEESSCSFLSRSPKFASGNGVEFRSLSAGENVSNGGASGSKMNGSKDLLQCHKDTGFNQQTSKDENSLQHIIGFKIGEETIHVDAHSCIDGDKLSIESMKAEVACLYYLQFSEEKRSKGLFPIIRYFMCGGKPLVSFDSIEDFKDYVCGNGWIEVIIDGWVQKRLMKLYFDCCKKLSEAPNMKLLKKLYTEVSEDEVILSDCGLQDVSISPFLSALQELKTISTLDISHNLLGNETMEKLQQIFVSSSQRYGGLTFDLHCNRFGPTALFQICECPVLFARLEVLNLSGNRLTDACSSYLSTILKDCKALYSLNIEQCSITSRTVQKIADALDAGSVLAQLCLGKNNPISGNVMINLLAKLATLNRFSELNLNGVKLSKLIFENLCQLAKSSSLSGLILGGTNIGTDGAVQLTEALSNGPQELVKLDLSYCALTCHDFGRLCANITMIASVVELNLGGNSIGLQGADALVSLLMNPECCLKVLILNKCHLEIGGVTRIIQALAENNTLEELNLAENADLGKDRALEYDLESKETLKPSLQNPNSAETSKKISTSEEAVAAQEGLPLIDPDRNGLEVADSEDGPIGDWANISNFDDSCASSCQRNPLMECELVRELSTAIGMAKQLEFLDLSSNGFSVEVGEVLYATWTSVSRCVGLPQKHLKEKILHFSMEGKSCCGVKSCCKRN